MFVDTSRIAVTADGEIDVSAVTPDMEVIYIRKKMGLEQSQKVVSALARMSGGKPATADADQVDADFAFDIGAMQMALAEQNIVAWAGGRFTGRPCTNKNIRALDPSEPIVTAALNAIGERNMEVLRALLSGGRKKSARHGVENGAATS